MPMQAPVTQPTLDSILLAFARQAQELPADLTWEQLIYAVASKLVDQAALSEDVYALLATVGCMMFRQASTEMECKQAAQGLLDRIQKNLHV